MNALLQALRDIHAPAPRADRCADARLAINHARNQVAKARCTTVEKDRDALLRDALLALISADDAIVAIAADESEAAE